MAIIHKKRLVLVEMQPIKLKNGTEKFKYTFLAPDNSIVLGYDNLGEYADLVVDSDGKYDDSQAHEFNFTPKEFEGKISDKLMTKKQGELSTSPIKKK